MASNALLHASRNSYQAEDGHTLLLMETVKGNKTFTDFRNVTSAIENLITVFDSHRKEEGILEQDYDITVFWDWIDSYFKSLDILIYDRNIVRYRRHECEEFKEIMVAKMSNLE